MKLLAETFSTFINYLRLGVKAGMVRSMEECLAGINAFKSSYLQVSLQGEQGMCNLLTILCLCFKMSLYKNKFDLHENKTCGTNFHLNRPFPSSLVPLFQNESKCETFHMKMSSACSFIFMQIKVSFIRMISHLDSL